MFSVTTTFLFGSAFPEWFGSIAKSMYTLFQILSLESWSMGISRPVMEQFPYAFLIFIPFIFLSSFVILNVFIAIIVNYMGQVTTEANKKLSLSEKENSDQFPTDQFELEIEILKCQFIKIENILKSQKLTNNDNS
jgi:voltage-gated sodium channel